MKKCLIAVYISSYLLLSGLSPVLADISDAEKNALINFYISTNGSDWDISTGWGQGNPCSWFGVQCSESEDRVTGLSFWGNRLTGTIHSSIKDLIYLEFLNLTNNGIEGNIPDELSSLSNLKLIGLGGNNLTGEIPKGLEHLSNLEGLYLWGNRLSGAVPPGIGSLDKLLVIDLSNNELSGIIPGSMGNLSTLESLDLSNNLFTGNIPQELGGLSGLKTLMLGENDLTGEIPVNIAGLSNLEILDLGQNRLSGTIPAFFENLHALKELNLQKNRLSGSIPKELGRLSQLETLLLDHNQLSGIIPKDLINLSSLSANGSDFRYNNLFSSDLQLRAFLRNKQNMGEWESSQSNPDLLYFPHIAVTSEWETEICIINTNDNVLNGIVKAYNDAGYCLPEDIILSLPPDSRKELNIRNEFAKPGKISYIIFMPDNPGASGYTKFFIPGRYRVALPAVSQVNSGDIYIPHIASSHEWWTGIGIINTTSSSKDMVIEFDNKETVNISLEPGEHKAFTIKSLFDDTSRADINSAIIRNAEGIVGLELFGSSANTGNNYLGGILLNNDTETTIYYPHIANDETWWTGIVTYNPSDFPCNLVITPYSADGKAYKSQFQTIQANGKYIGLIEDLNFPGGTAWFKVEASNGIIGFELFGNRDGTKLAGFTGIGVKSSHGSFIKIEQDGWTGIAFVNTENRPVKVNLTAYDDSGNPVGINEIELGPNEKFVDFAENMFTRDISAATYISYSSQGNLFGFQLNSSSDNMMLDALPGYKAVSNENNKPVAEAGIDRKVTAGSLVILDGSGSFDTDNDMITYSWEIISKPGSSDAKLFGSTYADPDFIADKDGNYKVRLIVNDGKVSSAADLISITAVSVFAAEADSLYSEDLIRCVDENSIENSCTMTTLPLIGQDFQNPGVEDIMDRVIVSHKWMADRFREVLQALPDDILTLFKATRAVFIACDVRPSNYWSYTGAVYIDPIYLWRTSQEKMTIDMTPDFRADFGRELNYLVLARYLKDNEYVYVSNWSSAETRSIDEIKYNIARLLYHELAHANDFIPPSAIKLIAKNQRYYDAVKSLDEFRISKAVNNTYPLASKMLRGLGQVKFHGESPSLEQIEITPGMVAEEFINDTANDDYNFSNIYEDVAMFFEEVMMYYNFGISRDIAITNVPEVPRATAYDYIVEWGQRNRIADPALREKAEFIVSRILPEIDWPGYFAALLPPIEMTAGESWKFNQYLSQNANESPVYDYLYRDIAIDRYEELELFRPYE